MGEGDCRRHQEAPQRGGLAAVQVRSTGLHWRAAGGGSEAGLPRLLGPQDGQLCARDLPEREPVLRRCGLRSVPVLTRSTHRGDQAGPGGWVASRLSAAPLMWRSPCIPAGPAEADHDLTPQCKQRGTYSSDTHTQHV